MSTEQQPAMMDLFVIIERSRVSKPWLRAVEEAQHALGAYLHAEFEVLERRSNAEAARLGPLWQDWLDRAAVLARIVPDPVQTAYIEHSEETIRQLDKQVSELTRLTTVLAAVSTVLFWLLIAAVIAWALK